MFRTSVRMAGGVCTQVRRRLAHPVLAAVICAVMVGAAPRTASASDPVYDEVGNQYGRGYFAPLPYERIDTVTGNVFLSFTDVVLPGNAGFNLSVVRTYNSRDARWHLGIGQAPLYFVYNLPNSDLDDVDFIAADGSKHNAAGGTPTTTTQEFWQFTKATYTLEMPNGLVATYGHVNGTYGRYLTELHDAFDNQVTFTWETGTDHLQRISQWVGGSPNHARYLDFDAWAGDMAASVTWNGRVWQYLWTDAYTGPIQLTGVRLPTGARWDFSYAYDADGAVKLASLTTPTGATVAYTWAPDTFPTTPAQRIAIKTRAVSGNVPPATWTFDWQNTGRRLVLTGPVNQVTYDTVIENDIPVGSSRTVATLGGTVLDHEALTYVTIPGALGSMPALSTATRVVDGRTFTTTYTYGTNDYADYGQPHQIVETGELTRTTVVNYTHSFSKYIRGRVASTTVTVGADSYTSSSTYNSTTGFRTAATSSGITTTYGNDGFGNVGTVTDASNRSTSYTYEWGVPKQVSSAAGTVTRTLTGDGTVLTETLGGTTTTYGYDAAGRVTSVNTNTSGRAPVTRAYTLVNDRWVGTATARGAMWATTDFDGYGRAIHTQDSTGVQSRTTYDAAGRVIYQSRPFGGAVAESGSTYTYDALNRLLTSTRGSDGSTVTHAYAGTTTSVTESVASGVSHTTTQHWSAFSPGDARLDSVTDAAGNIWAYGYDAIGNLRSVNGGGAVRTWTYNAANELISSTEPEQGQTDYYYDPAGRLDGVTDARGVSVTYGFDAAGRTVLVNAPGTAEDVATTYDANGDVATVSNGTVQTGFTYDSAHRVTSRTDVILGKTFTQTFTYDGLDNLTAATYPLSGRTVFYDYDTQGRLTAVRTSVNGGTSQTLANAFSYRGDGALASYTYGNGQTASTTFDVRNRPAHLVNGPLDITYAYDQVGNVTSVTDARPGYSSTFGYDALDRMTSVSGYGAMTFTYNSAGDRLTQATGAGTITFNYNGSRQLSSLTGIASGSFTYDATGSLLSDPSGATYTYSALSALKTATLGGQTTTYGYGPGGSRAVKTGPDGVAHLFVRGAGGPVAEYAAYGLSLIPVREYAYLGGQLLASFTPAPISPPNLSVTLLTPTDGQTMVSGQTIGLTASASAGGGLTIARVEYYVRGVYIGQSTTAPYTVPWTNTPLPGGAYLFTARVVSTDGHAVASTPAMVTVQ